MKKVFFLVVIVMGVFFLGACTSIAGGEISIQVDSDNIVIYEGDLFSIKPTVMGSNNALEYIVSDEEIFSVTNGIIEGVKKGTANLIIKVKDTDVSVTVAVSVLEKGGQPPLEEDTYNIANGDQNLEVGEVVLLQILKGADIFAGVVKWLSNNDSVAKIDNNGVITAISAGNAKVIAIIGSVPLTIDVVVRNESIVTVLPSSLKINGNNFVNVNNSTVLTATPDKGIITQIDWSSSDDTIATINESGLVTGVSVGVVTITAVSADNMDVYDAFIIVIKEAETSASPITSITIIGVKEVLAGNKIKLEITYTPASEVATFTYSSSNESVATVDQAGWVRGISGGVVTITATLVGDNSKSVTHTVTVIPLPEGFIITGATQVSYNQNIVLQAQAYPVGANNTVIWSSSNPSVASVDSNGRVTGLAVGSTTITATSITSADIKATHEVTVVDQMSVTLNPTTLSLTVGGSATINATVAAASLSDKSLVWTSSNTTVATVDSSGKVTAKAAGSTNIVAKLNAANSIQAQTTVTVTAAALPTINISNASLSLIAGTTKTLTATVSNATNTGVTWISSNAAVATVSSSGVVTGVAQGSATITATAVANTTVKATCAVTVTSAPSGSLVVTQSPTGPIAVGATGYQLFVDDSGGIAVSRLECTFTSSDSTVATVSTYGTIVALKAGTTTISVTHPTKGTGSIVLTIGGGTTPPVDPPVGTLAVSQSPIGSIQVGASGYQIYIKDSTGESLSRTECTFTSNASTVATVSEYGTISALKAGKATITVSHTKGSGTIVLTITANPVTPPETGTFAWAGHRGCSGAFVSNTVEAFQEGVRRGYKALECDIRVTKDNQFIIFHNEYLNYTSGERVLTEPKRDTTNNTGGSTPESKTLAQIKAMTVTQTRSASYPPAGTYTGKIATLGEYLDICKAGNVTALIEIKWTTGLNNNDKSKVAALLSYVNSKGMLSNSIFMTSMRDVLTEFRTQNSTVQLQWLCSSTATYNSYKSWALGKNISLDMEHSVLTTEMITEFHNKGLKVNTWTLNTISIAQTKISQQVDMITTDYLYHSGTTIKKYFA